MGVPQGERKGPPSGPRDIELGREAGEETAGAQGPGQRCLEQKGPGRGRSDLGKGTGPHHAPGFPSSLGRRAGVTRPQMGGAAAGARQRLPRAPTLPALALLALHGSSTGPRTGRPRPAALGFTECWVGARGARPWGVPLPLHLHRLALFGGHLPAAAGPGFQNW